MFEQQQEKACQLQLSEALRKKKRDSLTKLYMGEYYMYNSKLQTFVWSNVIEKRQNNHNHVKSYHTNKLKKKKKKEKE